MASFRSISIDGMLTYVGEFGPFQWLLEAAICLMVFPQTFQVLIMYFAALNPEWKCVTNSTYCLFNTTLASDDKARCDMPRSAWEYTQPSDYSIVTEFDIYCDKEWQIHLTTSIYFFSWGIGAIVLGWIADNYGRKTVIFPSFCMILIVAFASAFSPNVYFFIVARCIAGFFRPGTAVQEFILINEIVGSKYRPLVGSLMGLAFTAGLCLLGLQAYFIRQWKTLFIVVTIPYIFAVAFYKFVPESVRWLRLHGRNEEVAAIFRRIARWNKKKIPDELQVAPATSNESKGHHSSPMDLFRHRKIALQSLAQGYAWLVEGMVYYGLSLAADDLGGSLYSNYVLLSAVEFPACLFIIYSCERFGRKKTVIYPLLIGSVTCIILACVPIEDGGQIARICLGMIGKFFITVSFNAIFTWSVEIYPTTIRAEGMGFLQVTSRIGAATSPWVAKGLRKIHTAVPFILMGTLGLIGAVFLIHLPETKGVSTAESENDMKSTNDIGMNDMVNKNEIEKIAPK